MADTQHPRSDLAPDALGRKRPITLSLSPFEHALLERLSELLDRSLSYTTGWAIEKFAYEKIHPEEIRNIENAYNVAPQDTPEHRRSYGNGR